MNLWLIIVSLHGMKFILPTRSTAFFEFEGVNAYGDAVGDLEALLLPRNIIRRFSENNFSKSL